MHRSPGFNPPEKESTRTSTVDCEAAAAAGRRFKEEHRRENKNRDIYTFPPLLQSFLQVFFKETVHPARYPSARGYLERKDSSGYFIYIYIYVRWGNLWKDDEFENEFMELKKLLEKGLLKGC